MPFDPDKEEAVSLPAFEVSPDLTFLHPVGLEIPYPDEDSDGIVDGTPFPATATQAYFLSEDGWYRALSVARTDRHVVIGTDYPSVQWLLWAGRWKAGSRVTFFIHATPSSMTGGGIGEAETDLHSAFVAWMREVDSAVVFESTTSEESADIVINSQDLCLEDSDYHSTSACDAAAGVFRKLSSLGHPRLYFNNRPDVVWVVGGYSSYDPEALFNAFGRIPLPFLRIALHEVGHIMGLGGDSQPWYASLTPWADPPEPCNAFPDFSYPTSGGMVMYYECDNDRPLIVLSAFDSAEVRGLYGLGVKSRCRHLGAFCLHWCRPFTEEPGIDWLQPWLGRTR